MTIACPSVFSPASLAAENKNSRAVKGRELAIASDKKEQRNSKKNWIFRGPHQVGYRWSHRTKILPMQFFYPWCSFMLDGKGDAAKCLEETIKLIENKGLDASLDFISDVRLCPEGLLAYPEEILNALSPKEISLSGFTADRDYKKLWNFIADYPGLFATPISLTLGHSTTIDSNVSEIFSRVPTLKHLFIEEPRPFSNHLDDLPLCVLNQIDSLVVQPHPNNSEIWQNGYTPQDFLFLSKRNKPFRFLGVGNLKDRASSKLELSFFYEKSDFCTLLTSDLKKHKTRISAGEKLVIVNFHTKPKYAPKLERRYAEARKWEVMGSEGLSGPDLWELNVHCYTNRGDRFRDSKVSHALNGSRWILRRMADGYLKFGQTEPEVLKSFGTAWMGSEADVAESMMFPGREKAKEYLRS